MLRCLLPITVMVLSRLGRKPPRFIAELNVAGDGLLDRARSISFVLLGSAAAIGLGLVALVSQVGWPNLLDGPIPGLPIEHVAARNRAVSPAPASPVAGAVHRRSPSLKGTPAGAGGALAAGPRSLGRGRSRLSGSKQVLAPVPTSPPGNGVAPSRNGPSSAPANPPPAAPTPSAPTSPGPVAPSPPVAVTATDHLGEGHQRGRGSSPGENSPPNGGDHGHMPHAPAGGDGPPGQSPDDPGSPGHSPGGPGQREGPPPQGETAPGFGHGHAYGHYGR